MKKTGIFVGFIVVLFLNFYFAALSSAAESSLPQGCEQNLRRTLSALVGGAPLVFADVAIGEAGVTFPGLANSFSVPNEPREVINGLEYPSELEVLLNDKIINHPCFRAFEQVIQLGTEDQSGNKRSILQIQIPYADMQALTVEYLPGKFRKNYLYKLTFSFELRDGDGRVIFSRLHAENFRRTCFQESTSDGCMDLAGNAIDLDDGWNLTLNQGLTQLLAGTAFQMQEWYDSLRSLRDEFYDRSYSQEIEISGVQARNRGQLSQPYLFIQTPIPRININGLLAGLNDRGLTPDLYSRDELQRYYNILFRGLLDNSLRNRIAELGDARNSRILLLSDAQGNAFANAMMIACAEQSRGYNQEDCLAPILLIEKLCQPGEAPDPRIRDKCLLASMSFGRSVTRSSEEQLESLREAEQHIQLAAHLRKPEELRMDNSASYCINSRTSESLSHIVGISQKYLRIGDSEENDDRIYLMDAALSALQQQAECLSNTIVTDYQQMLSNG